MGQRLLFQLWWFQAYLESRFYLQDFALKKRKTNQTKTTHAEKKKPLFYMKVHIKQYDFENRLKNFSGNIPVSLSREISKKIRETKREPLTNSLLFKK